jgi:hypothetical protein
MTPEERARFDRIERLLEQLVDRQAVRQWYSFDKFARLVGKAAFTVRRWCYLGRVRAERSMTRSGPPHVWAVGHDEHLRYQRARLLPASRAAVSRTPTRRRPR